MGSYHESRENSKEDERNEGASAEACAAGHSDPGCEREANEDRFLIFIRDDIEGYFVFDGMGGRPAGEAAAQISADVIQRALDSFQGGDLGQCLKDVIDLAQEAVVSRGQDPASAGMGTTVVGILTRGDEVVVGGVGDSRAYHIKPDSIAQVTSDHTLVQQLVDAGQLSPHDALVHPQSHILTRCIGSRLDFAIDATCYRLISSSRGSSAREWLLLCSDGLYSLVADDELRAIVLNNPPEEATRKLIAIARARGGFDNITALIIPLKGHMVERSAALQQMSEGDSAPLAPEEFLSSSEFNATDLFEDGRGKLCRGAGTVVVLGVVALIVTALLMVLFTEGWGSL
jgi:serine/threonine protein phosphatase PrpC